MVKEVVLETTKSVLKVEGDAELQSARAIPVVLDNFGWSLSENSFWRGGGAILRQRKPLRNIFFAKGSSSLD